MATLYFRQLLAGRDFGAQTPYAGQMANFVYLIGDRDTGEALIVDPAWAVRELVDIAAADDMTITGALVTHYHPDHCGGNMMGLSIDGLPTLLDVAPCPIHVHKAEAHGVKFVTGVSDSDLVTHDSNDVVKVGGVEVELLHTPGHTPGSLCFKVKDSLISGDTLFLSGCGRTDLPGGDSDELFRSLQKLRKLPGETTLFPGHNYGGHSAPIESVRASNIYFKPETLQQWHQLHNH